MEKLLYGKMAAKKNTGKMATEKILKTGYGKMIMEKWLRNLGKMAVEKWLRKKKYLRQNVLRKNGYGKNIYEKNMAMEKWLWLRNLGKKLAMEKWLRKKTCTEQVCYGKMATEKNNYGTKTWLTKKGYRKWLQNLWKNGYGIKNVYGKMAAEKVEMASEKM